MTDREKYAIVLEMSSIGRSTAGTYPTFQEFRDALRNERVYGDYDRRVVIVSNNPGNHIQYIFVRE